MRSPFVSYGLHNPRTRGLQDILAWNTSYPKLSPFVRRRACFLQNSPPHLMHAPTFYSYTHISTPSLEPGADSRWCYS